VFASKKLYHVHMALTNVVTLHTGSKYTPMVFPVRSEIGKKKKITLPLRILLCVCVSTNFTLHYVLQAKQRS
jgi:hypothetical protein